MDITLENRDRIIALLREGICPICGKKYANPLIHISKTHGIPAEEFKDTLLLRRNRGFASPEVSEKYRQVAIRSNHAKNLTPGNKLKKTSIEKRKQQFAIKDHYKKHPEHLKAFKEGQRKNAKKAARTSAVVTQKPVVRVSETGEIKHYKSISDAARENKISTGSICRCISGKYRTAGGYFWGTPNNIPAPEKVINTKSGIRGVSWCKTKRKWLAHIWHNGKSINLGRFADIKDAIEARKKAEELYFKPIEEKQSRG